MKIKTSVTLSEELLEQIDRRGEQFKNRSDFLEIAAKAFLARLERDELNARDLEIINRNADRLNCEAADVLDYQVEL
jgi:metal-responsive CopG/Arc/MetJ family transcriptional regulator